MANNKRKGFSTSVYIKTENGKKIKKSVYAKTEKELKNKVKILKQEINNGKDITISNNFGFWCDKWLNEVKIPSDLSSGTLTEYKTAIKHLKGWFGDYDFKKINLSMFQIRINELTKNNPNTNKPASKKLLTDIKKTAKSVFRYAELNRVANVPNFVDAIVISKNATKKERGALSFEEQQMIINTPHRAQIAAMIMMFAGLRRGELIALKWDDINLDEGTVVVNKAADIQNNSVIIKDKGKTKNALRTIYIPPILIDYLKKYQRNDGSYVLQKASGGPMTKSAYVKMWDSYWCDLNVKYGYANQNVSKYNPNGLPMKIKKRDSHECRHTFATIMYLQGIDIITAKEMFGHSDSKLLIETYTDSKRFNLFSINEEYRSKLENEYKIVQNMFKVPENVPESAKKRW